MWKGCIFFGKYPKKKMLRKNIQNRLAKCCVQKMDLTSQASKSLSRAEIFKIRDEKLCPAVKATAFYKNPLLIERGFMQHLWDNDGKKYLDLFGGIVTVSVGHCHPKVNEALKRQIDKLWHTTSIYMTAPVHEYIEKLTAKMPGNLKVCYIVNSGSEANDLALLMAKIHTGNSELISLRNGYHGLTQAVAAVTNLSTWKQPVQLNFGIHRTVNPDPYRGPWGGSHCRDSSSQTDRNCFCTEGVCDASKHYVDQLEDLLIHSVPKKGVAGMIIESIQGVGGSVQFPKNFVSRAFERIRERGGVCISDEVQTGFGRLGSHFWGFETHNAMPDIVTMAKGIGNGFPLAAVVTTPEIASSLSGAAHFNTFGGNPLACTVGSTVLDVIEEEKLQENSAEVGTYFINKLMELKSKSSIIGDVRGKGLMIGMELVSHKEKRTPLESDKVLSIFEAIKDRGILIGKGGLHGNVFRIKPPMCITKEDVKEAMVAFNQTMI